MKQKIKTKISSWLKEEREGLELLLKWAIIGITLICASAVVGTMIRVFLFTGGF